MYMFLDEYNGPTDMVVHPISDHGPTDMVVHPISNHGPTDMVVHPLVNTTFVETTFFKAPISLLQ